MRPTAAAARLLSLWPTLYNNRSPARYRRAKKWALARFFCYEALVAEMALENIQEKVAQIAERVASSEGIELVEVECKGNPGSRIVRVFIDKPGGVTHTDCELALSPKQEPAAILLSTANHYNSLAQHGRAIFFVQGDSPFQKHANFIAKF